MFIYSQIPVIYLKLFVKVFCWFFYLETIFLGDDPSSEKVCLHSTSSDAIPSQPKALLYYAYKNVVMFTFSFFYYRVCKKWKECSRCPVLWKTVDVKFSWCGASQTKVAASFIENLPCSVMHLKLDFSLVFDKWVEQLDFEAFFSRLKEKCPRLRVFNFA